MTLLLPFKTVSIAAGEIIWEDDFTGTAGSAPNSAHWTVENQSGANLGAGADEYYLPANVDLDGNGNLRIKTKQETFGGQPYTSGRITSAYKVYIGPYGRVEARIKLPAGSADSGLWPAFWLMGSEEYYGQWPRNGEVDIMEGYNDMRQIYCAVHGPTEADPNTKWFVEKSWIPGEAMSDDFHEYALEWTPDALYFFVDDILINTIKKSDMPAGNTWAFNDRYAHIILNTAVGGGFLVDTPDGSIPASGVDMLVDYVRYRAPVATTPTFPKSETLTATFDNQEEFPNGTSGNITTSGGKLNIAVTSAYDGSSSRTVDFTDSSVYVNFSTTPNVGNGSTEQLLQVQERGSTTRNMAWKWNNGNIIPIENINTGSETSGTSIAYNATTHKYLRLRHGSGNMYWDYSADGTNWTNHRTVAITYGSVAFTTSTINLVSGYWGSETTPGTASFDNVNVVEATKAGSESASLAVTEQASIQVGLSTTDTASVSVSEGTPSNSTSSTVTESNSLAVAEKRKITDPTKGPNLYYQLRPTLNTSFEDDVVPTLYPLSGQTATFTTSIVEDLTAPDGKKVLRLEVTGAGQISFRFDSLPADSSLQLSYSVHHRQVSGTLRAVYILRAYSGTEAGVYSNGTSSTTNTGAWHRISVTSTLGTAYNWAAPGFRADSVAVGDVFHIDAYELEYGALSNYEPRNIYGSESRSLTVSDTSDIVGQPKISTFTSNFDSSTGWSTVFGSATYTGILTIDADDTGSRVRTTDHYDFSETNAVIEVPQPSLAAGGSGDTVYNSFKLVRSNSSSQSEQFLISSTDGSATVIEAYHNSNAVQTGVTYDSNAHRWLRIRRTGSTVYFEVSPDGSTWNSFGSTATTNGVGSWRTEISASTELNTTGHGNATFDNYNLESTSTPKAGSESNSLAISEDASIAISYSSTDTAALSVTETQEFFRTLTSSETSAVSVGESAQTLVTASPADTGAIAVSESSTLDSSTTSTDTGSVAVSESRTIDSYISSTDTGSVAVSESRTIDSYISSTDTGSFVISESQTSSISVNVSESNALAVSETTSSFRTVEGDETVSLAAADISNIESTLPAQESIAVSTTESVTIDVTLSGTESNSLAVDETASIYRALTATESNTLSVDDTSASALSSASTDAGSLAIDEAVSGSALVTASESNSIAVSDTGSVAVYVSQTDGAALSADESTSGDTTASASESNSISISESASTARSSQSEDTLTFGLTESTSNDATFTATESNTLEVSETSTNSSTGQVDESNALAISESVSLDVTLTAAESSDLAVSETTSGEVTASDSDTGSIALTDVGVIESTLPGQETLALAVGESASIDVYSSATDEGSIALSETEHRDVFFDSSDAVSVSVSESASNDVTSSAAESNTLEVSEEVSLYKDIAVEASDTGSLAVAETTSSFRTLSADDTSGLDVSETASNAITDSATDTDSLSVTETSAQDVTSTATETNTLVVSEAASNAVYQPSVDTNSISVSESSESNITVASTDGGSLEVSETTSGYATVAASDSAALAVTSVTNAANSAPANESITIGIDEQSNLFVTSAHTDESGIGVDETAQTSTYSSAAETNSIELTESVSIEVAFSTSESNSLSVDETESRNVFFQSADEGALSVDEATSAVKQVSASEDVTLEVTETSGADIAQPGMESISLGIVEETTTYAEVDSSDSLSLAFNDEGVVNSDSTPEEYTALAVSESADTFVTQTAYDESTLSATESRNVHADNTPTTDTGVVAVVEQTTIFVTTEGDDNAIIGIESTAHNFVTTPSSDQSGVGVGESTSENRSLTSNEAVSVAADESSALSVHALMSGEDSGDLGVSESASIFIDSPGGDSSTIQVEESSAIVVTGVIVKDSVDTLDVVASEGAAVQAGLAASDPNSLNVSETTSGSNAVSAADTSGLSVAESRATAVSTSAADSSGLAVNETNHIRIEGLAYGESLDLAVDEQAFVEPIMAGHDPVSVRIDETNSIVVSGAVTKSASDGLLIGLAEQSWFLTYLSRSDTDAIALAESVSFATITFTATDTGSIAVTERITKPGYAEDVLTVALEEQIEIVVEEFLSEMTEGDSLTVLVSEHSHIWLIGGENTPVEFASKSGPAIISSTSSRDGSIVETRSSDNKRSESTRGRKIRVE